MFKNFKIKNGIIALSLIGCISVAEASDTVKIGVIAPLTGTLQPIGDSVTKGIRQYVNENSGMIAGKKIEIFTIDDESDVNKAQDNVKKLINRDNVDVIIGSIHTGVTSAIAKVAVQNKKLLIIPVAGANDLTNKLCSPYIFRTSYSNWQISAVAGQAAAQQKLKKAVTIYWDYGFGEESVNAFKETYVANGGHVIKDIKIKFPDVNFNAALAEIKELNPDMVFAVFAGAAAAKFSTDYNNAGLHKLPLYSNGYLTEGNTYSVSGEGGAEGILTTFPYADNLKNEKNDKFVNNFISRYKKRPNTFNVTGYDALQLYNEGLKAADGDPKNIPAIISGMEKAKIISPRGEFSLNSSHNPIQNMYLRKVKDNSNDSISIAATNLNDPSKDCLK